MQREDGKTFREVQLGLRQCLPEVSQENEDHEVRLQGRSRPPEVVSRGAGGRTVVSDDELRQEPSHEEDSKQ